MPRFIAPSTGHEEVVLAKDQPEYFELVVGKCHVMNKDMETIPNAYGHIMRVTFNEDERKRIANGEDVLFIQVYYRQQPATPVQVKMKEDFVSDAF